MTEISVKAKEWWPDSEKEGWGEVETAFTVAASCNFRSIDNCGLTLLTHVTGGATPHRTKGFPKMTSIPTEFRNKYFDLSWGSCIHREMEKAFYAMQESITGRLQDATFKHLMEYIRNHARGYNCIVMTAPVNQHSPTRTGAEKATYTKESITTAWFARQLIERKCGYIVQSPIAVNHVHINPRDFSLIRAWIWFPEGALAFKPDKFLGYGKILSRDALVEKVKANGNFQGNYGSKYTVEEYVDSYK